MVLQRELGAIRGGLGRALFGMVAGPDGPDNRARIHGTPGPRWFAEDRPIRRVHGDASMFVGGLRALLLQSLHPLAMAGVAQHSDYRGDPWGRLQRTSTFLAVTTFGTATDAQRAVDKVRGIHRRVHGVGPDGTPYHASDPHLLEWVHIAEIDSFLLAHSLYGARPLDQRGRDGYVADTARVATALGVENPPRTEAELRERIEAFRPELRGTAAARDAARFLLLTPPLPLPARAPYGVLAATSVAMLPAWARLPLRLPYLPPLEATAVRLSGRILVGGIRWAMTAAQDSTSATAAPSRRPDNHADSTRGAPDGHHASPQTPTGR
ncbi:oxygenase MpaB family protein [Mycobacterium sp. 852013-51886_SCH5428379]|uniref:oxygenase MpaB family protein n=1 Tax=Mycobacterium sp. 852013-51886_SCH5428379 TaxID=1834111 RepID=UPI000A67732D|nr:oxygenase MpaB family protein [Mycobacterium sp. 852013-51886_SCH5428379]